MNVIIACYVAGFWEVFRIVTYIVHLFGLGYTANKFADMAFFKGREFHRAQREALRDGIYGIGFVLLTGFAFYGIPNGQTLIDILTAL
jgi:hypothetical protein